MTIATLFFLTLLPFHERQAPAVEDIDARLQRGQARFDESCAEARAKLLEACEQAAATSTDQGLLERLRSDRADFEQSGRLPAAVPESARTYERALADALERYQRELVLAGKSLREAARHERAQELEQRAAELALSYPRAHWTDLRCRAELEGPDAPVWNAGSLFFDGTRELRLELSAPRLAAGEGYELALKLERVAGSGGLQLRYPRADREESGPGLLILGGFGGETSGLELVDNASAAHNPTTYEGPVLETGRVSELSLISRPESTVVKVDGRTIVDWDAPERLTLPAGLERESRRSSRAITLLVPAGTRLRLDAAHSRVLPAEFVQSEKPNEDAPAASSAPDFLSLGTSWQCTWFDDKDCDVKVIERSRSAQSATLRLQGEKGGVLHVTVTTNDDGSKLKLTDIDVKSAPPGTPRDYTITLKSGTGRVSSAKLSMKFSWKVEGPNYSKNRLIELHTKR